MFLYSYLTIFIYLCSICSICSIRVEKHCGAVVLSPAACGTNLEKVEQMEQTQTHRNATARRESVGFRGLFHCSGTLFHTFVPLKKPRIAPRLNIFNISRY